MKKIISGFIVLSLIFLSGCGINNYEFRHVVAAIEDDKFLAWPANNGIWQWGDEILVGFTRGEYTVRSGHNIAGVEESWFTRSLDGGETWHMFKPDDFMDDDNIKWVPDKKRFLEQPLNFEHEGFAMRVFATGYHGNDDPEGGFYYSYDRGSTWQGPWYLGDINNHAELRGKEITARTDYIVTGEKELYLFISANYQNPRNNRIACIRTEDGGMSFEFVSWITPEEPYFNPIMSSTVRISENTFVLAHRNRYFGERDNIRNSIEAYISQDLGQTWRSPGPVKHFESGSNPPALLQLKDGRLVCIYGDRHNLVMAGKFSDDNGKSWGEEFIINKNLIGVSDFGYPRLLQRKDGKLVAIYYWASEDNLQQHIAATIWKP